MIKFVPKTWGYEKWIVNNDKYCGKLLRVVEGQSCSLHYHKIKDETFYVQSGSLLLRYVDLRHFDKRIDGTEFHRLRGEGLVNEVILSPGDSVHLPPRTVHIFEAEQDTDLFEFSTQHLDSDTYRINK